MSKVSVIIPSYNRAELLSEAINSILSQSLQDFEIIIVDDGSTDNTKEAVSVFSGKDSRIRYIYQENKGVAEARNKGCAEAKGEYIAFLDSDDKMLAGRLKKQIEILDANSDIGLVYGTLLVNNIHQNTTENFGFVLSGVISHREMFMNLLKLHLFFNISTVTMRKGIFEKYRFYPSMQLGEDFLFFLQVSRDYLFYGVDRPFAMKKTGHDSMVKDRFNSRFDEKLALDILLHDKHKKINLSAPLYLQSVSDLYLYYAKDYFMKGIRLRYLIYLLKSLLYYPFNQRIYKHLVKQGLKGIILDFIPERYLISIKKIYYLYALNKFQTKNEPDLEIVKGIVKEGDSVFDIGANVGWYTKSLSRLVGRDGRVVSIEPNPETFSILSYCKKRLNFDNVKALNFAISDKEGTCEMEVPRYDYGGFNYYQTRIIDSGKKDNSYKYFKVTMKPLDSFIQEFKNGLTFIKCDVEGHELSVVKGALKIISEFKPIWLIEISTDPDQVGSPAYELFRIMGEKGYVAYWNNGKTLYRRNKDDKSINYFFIPKEKVNIL